MRRTLSQILALAFLFILLATTASAQVSVALMPNPRVQPLDPNGRPLPGGCLFFWNAGTSTPAPTYVDVVGVSQNTNPVIFDSGGYATIYLAAQSYKVALFSAGGTNCASGSQIWMQDNVSAFQILTQAQNVILVGTIVDPAGSAGQLGYRSDLGRVRFFNSAWDSIPGLNTVDTLTNKTLTAPVITSPVVTNGTFATPSVNGVIADAGAPATGQVWTATSTTHASYQNRVIGIPFIIDGAGAVITTGTAGYLEIPFNCTITGWTVLGDQVGSAVIDVLRSTYGGFPTTATITGADPPTLVTAQKNQNLAVTLWTTAITAGDILEFNVTSATTVTRVTVALKLTIP